MSTTLCQDVLASFGEVEVVADLEAVAVAQDDVTRVNLFPHEPQLLERGRNGPAGRPRAATATRALAHG